MLLMIKINIWIAHQLRPSDILIIYQPGGASAASTALLQAARNDNYPPNCHHEYNLIFCASFEVSPVVRARSVWSDY